MQRVLHIIIGLFVFVCTIPGGMAQTTFPVTVTPRVVPPAPIYLSSYANAMASVGPLQLQLLLNDLNVPSREVRLKAYFEGNGISAQSNTPVAGAPALVIEGGTPLVLVNTELAPYFEFSNLIGINPNVYGSPLPEGSYEFCFEVYDAVSGNRISQKSCVSVYIFHNEPPFLVLPQNNSEVAEQNPQNIVFQWTPRHINVSNVEYELSIVEIWDYGVDPQAAFLSSPPVFQTTTRNTTYVYGPVDPLLLTDRRYAWRVQAKALSGTEEIGMFKNHGYSEIFWFNHTAPCQPPLQVSHEVKGTHQANIHWEALSYDVSEYSIRYREKGNNNEWFYSRSTADWITLWDLRTGTTYEYQVAKKCALTESEYSPAQTFTTFIADNEEGLYDCGIAPDADIANRDPLPDLRANEEFRAGDFPVKVAEASGSNGKFTGTGYVTIPYLKNIKVAVKFTNILINTDRQLVEGMVITVYDPSWDNMLGVDDVADAVDDVVNVITGGEVVQEQVDFVIDDIRVEDGNIIITGTDGEIKTIRQAHNDVYNITDAQGNNWAVDEKGNVEQVGEADPSPPLTADNAEGIKAGSHSGTLDDPVVEQISEGDVEVIFRKGEDSRFELDIVDNEYERNSYPSLTGSGGEKYYPVHKAVMEGETEVFYADIVIENNAVDMDSLIVKTVKNTAIKHERLAGTNTLKITLSGYNPYHTEEAVITYLDKADNRYKIAATFFIHHIKKQEEVKVQVVKVNGGREIAGLEDRLNDIYGKAGSTFRITGEHSLNLDATTWDTNGNGMIDYDGSGLLSDYPAELRNIHREFRRQNPGYDPKAYYLFILGGDIKVSKPLSGFMPKTRQWGYLFEAHYDNGLENKDTPAKIAAHELGHGVFTLAHPFGENVSSAGNAPNLLMDYGNGTELGYPDWQMMNDPGLKLYFFQEDEGSELAGKWWFTPDWKLFKTDSTNVVNTTKINEVPQGTVPGITYNNLPYDARFDEGGNFLGYYYGNTKFDRMQQLDRMNNARDSVFLLKNNGQCRNEWYGTTYGYAIENKERVDYTNTGKVIFKGMIRCGICNYGQQFYDTYITSVRTEAEKESLLKVSELICEKGEDYYKALVSQIEKLNLDKKDSYFWESEKYMFRRAQEMYWDRPDAWENYLLALDNIITLFEEKTDLQNVNTADLFFLLEYCSVDLLGQISAKEKVEILQFILTNEIFITEGNLLRLFMRARNEEGLIVKLVAAVSPEQSGEFLEELQNYTVGDKNVFAKLMAAIDDAGGKNYFTAFNQMLFVKFIESRGGLDRYITGYKDMEVSFKWYRKQMLWRMIEANLEYRQHMDDYGSIEVVADFKIAKTLNGSVRHDMDCLKGDCDNIWEIVREYDGYFTFRNFVKPVTLDPYEVVLVEFTTGIEELNIEEQTYLPMPAFFFYAILNHGDWEMLKQDVSDITTIGTSVFAGGALIKGAQGISKLIAVSTLFFNTTNTVVLTDEVIGWLEKEPSGKGNEFLEVYRLANVLNDITSTYMSGEGAELLFNVLSSYFAMEGSYYEEFGKPFKEQFPGKYQEIMKELNKLK